MRHAPRADADLTLMSTYDDFCDPGALLTDLYQLTMLQAYFDRSMHETAVFELFVRRLPENRNFLVARTMLDPSQHGFNGRRLGVALPDCCLQRPASNLNQYVTLGNAITFLDTDFRDDTGCRCPNRYHVAGAFNPTRRKRNKVLFARFGGHWQSRQPQQQDAVQQSDNHCGSMIFNFRPY